MTAYKFALLWSISICNNIHISKAFVVTPTSLIEPTFSEQQSPIVRPHKNYSFRNPLLPITTVSATPVSFISLEKDLNPSNLKSEQREKLLDEALGSNTTAALILLREISDMSENGSVEDKLLDLVDGSIDSDDNQESGNDLPVWTKVRIFSKFSRRARRASLRRVLNSSNVAVDDNNDDDRSRRRNALVFILRYISQSMSPDDGKAGTMKYGSSGSSGFAIWNIERDARRERKNAAPVSQGVFPGLEQMDSEELYITLEEPITLDEGKDEKVEDWATSVPMDKSPVVPEGLSRQKFEQDSEVLARTLEQKKDAIATEQTRLQAIIERNRKLEAEREKDTAAAAARAIEHARVQVIADRHRQLEAGREREVAAKAAEQAKLQLIVNERNQRSILTSRLELDVQLNAKEKANREREAAAAGAAAARATEKARIQAISDRHQKLEVEKEREAAARAIEQVKLQLVANERNQRTILSFRLELDAKRSAAKKAKKERELADTAAAAARATEKARVQAINERHQKIEAERRASKEREAAAVARATEKARIQAINDRHQQLEVEEEREAAARAIEQAQLQLVANERNQRTVLSFRLELDAKRSAAKRAKKERELADTAAAAARATEKERVQAISDRHHQLEVEKEREAAGRAIEQAKLQLIAGERDQQTILSYRLELDAKQSAAKKAKKERELADTAAAAARATEKARVQAINERHQQLEAERRASKEREAAAVARTTEKARIQAISHRHQQLEVEKERKLVAIFAEQAKLQLIANEEKQRGILKSHLELDVKLRALDTENRARKDAAELAKKVMMVEGDQRAILTATLEQEAMARAIRIEEAVKVSKDLNAELECKQRHLLEAQLQIETAAKVERERKEKADAIANAEREREALAMAEVHRKQQSKAINVQKDKQGVTSEIDKPANAAESEQLLTSAKMVEVKESTILPIDEEEEVATISTEEARCIAITNARKQPKSKEEERVLADYYGSMGDEERAFTILYDLGMIDITLDPEGPEYEVYLSNI